MLGAAVRSGGGGFVRPSPVHEIVFPLPNRPFEIVFPLPNRLPCLVRPASRHGLARPKFGAALARSSSVLPAEGCSFLFSLSSIFRLLVVPEFHAACFFLWGGSFWRDAAFEAHRNTSPLKIGFVCT